MCLCGCGTNQIDITGFSWGLQDYCVQIKIKIESEHNIFQHFEQFTNAPHMQLTNVCDKYYCTKCLEISI